MGITSLSLDRINRYLKPNDSILLFGCQNLYSAELYMQIAHPYFESLGHTVRSIDILGCNGSEVADLREPLDLGQFDMVNDCGSAEHVDGSLYMPFKNMNDACKMGGVMIHENPKTKSWHFHGNHYFTEEFYVQLAFCSGYKILELTSEAAMSNTIDGWNVSCVLQKCFEDFMSEGQFQQIYDTTIKSE